MSFCTNPWETCRNIKNKKLLKNFIITHQINNFISHNPNKNNHQQIKHKEETLTWQPLLHWSSHRWNIPVSTGHVGGSILLNTEVDLDKIEIMLRRQKLLVDEWRVLIDEFEFDRRRVDQNLEWIENWDGFERPCLEMWR